MKIRKRLAAMVTIALLATPAAAMATADSAAAVGRTGQDPLATGCSNGAQTHATARIWEGSRLLGTVEVRWSPTCKTNWVRITYNSGLGSYNYGQPTLALNDGQRSFGPVTTGPVGSGYQTWTPMIYAPTQLAQGHGFVANRANGQYRTASTVWAG